MTIGVNMTIEITDKLILTRLEWDRRDPAWQDKSADELVTSILRRYYAERDLSTLGILLEYRRQAEAES